MDTMTKLQNDFVLAMKNKNEDEKLVIRSIFSEIKNLAITKGCKDNVSEEIITQGILKVKKIIQEEIDTCPKERIDRLEQFQAHLEIINRYAPKMMNEEEIKETIFKIVKEKEIQLLPKNKGLIMKNIMPELRGKADGKLVNKVVLSLF